MRARSHQLFYYRNNLVASARLALEQVHLTGGFTSDYSSWPSGSHRTMCPLDKQQLPSPGQSLIRNRQLLKHARYIPSAVAGELIRWSGVAERNRLPSCTFPRPSSPSKKLRFLSCNIFQGNNSYYNCYNYEKENVNVITRNHYLQNREVKSKILARHILII